MHFVNSDNMHLYYWKNLDSYRSDGFWYLDHRSENDGTNNWFSGGWLAKCRNYMCLFYQAIN